MSFGSDMFLSFCSSVLELGFTTLWNNRERYNDITRF